MSTSVTQAETPTNHLTWQHLAPIVGIIATASMAIAAVLLRDLEAAGVTVAYAVATLLVRSRHGKLGAIGMIVVSVVTLAFMTPAAIANIRAGSGVPAVFASAGLATVALLAIITHIGVLTGSESTIGPRTVIAISALLLVGMVSAGALRTSEQPEIDFRLVANHVAFSTDAFNVNSGRVTVALENKDLFWHTFTIEDLGVNLWVPVGAELTTTFDASPGAYEFICVIPGHPQAGMRGTLTVSG